MQLLNECESLCDLLLTRRRYVISDQLLRAALSVAANIAEGQGKLSKADNVRHLAIARGSLCELLTILASRSVRALSAPEIERAEGFADEVGRMLTCLIRKLGTRHLE